MGTTASRRVLSPPPSPCGLHNPCIRDSRGFYGQSVYQTDARISSGWSLLTDHVAEFDRPRFPPTRVARRCSGSDLLSGARAGGGRCWPHSLGTASDTAERALGDPPNTGDFVRRKITFLGRRTRKLFSLTRALSLSRSRREELDSFRTIRKFRDIRSAKAAGHRSPKRVIRSKRVGALIARSYQRAHPRKARSVYFVSAAYDDILLRIDTYTRRLFNLQFKFVFPSLHMILTWSFSVFFLIVL